MVRCPRCGDDAEQLHPLPPEARTEDAAAGASDRRGDSRACRWCLHELNEG